MVNVPADKTSVKDNKLLILSTALLKPVNKPVKVSTLKPVTRVKTISIKMTKRSKLTICFGLQLHVR